MHGHKSRVAAWNNTRAFPASLAVVHGRRIRLGDRVCGGAEKWMGAQVHVQGWRAAIVGVVEIPVQGFVESKRRWVWSYPNDRLLILCEVVPRIAEGFFSEMVRFLGLKNVNPQSNQGQYFENSFRYFPPFLYVVFGLFFVGWDWFWWKGLHYHPYGIGGYILASVSIAVGLCLLWGAMDRSGIF